METVVSSLRPSKNLSLGLKSIEKECWSEYIVEIAQHSESYLPTYASLPSHLSLFRSGGHPSIPELQGFMKKELYCPHSANDV